MPELVMAISLLVSMLVPAWVGAQTAQHVASVARAQKSAYAVTESTNGCPSVQADMFGWPKAIVRHCEYAKKDLGLRHPRKAVAYLAEIKPEIIARWIEGACSELTAQASGCFDRVLELGRLNSGYMFAISGNVIEDMREQDHFQNYFFRNGMTSAFQQGVNGSSTELSLDRQEQIALLPNDAVIAIPTGTTRLWRTTPKQFFARFPQSGALPDLRDSASRQAWLAVVQKEMLDALSTGQNRLLEAYLCSIARDEFHSSCRPPQ